MDTTEFELEQDIEFEVSENDSSSDLDLDSFVLALQSMDEGARAEWIADYRTLNPDDYTEHQLGFLRQAFSRLTTS